MLDQQVPRIALSVIAGLFALTACILGAAFATRQLHQDRQSQQLRADVDELKALAKEQDATIQAMAGEVDQLRGEVRRAREDLEAARTAVSGRAPD